MDLKLSIIVPVYNVENYIEKCLRTLVNQTIDNYEIIVVVDGSTDNSINIIKEYKEKYPNIVTFYETENYGLSAARNYGLGKAKGEYIGFIDSDDYVTLDMFEKLYNHAISNCCDIVVCDYYKITNKKRKKIELGITNNDTKEEEILKSRPYAWNKLYKKSLFEKYNIYFPEGLIFEDICTIYPLLLQAKKIGYVNEVMYCYIYNRNDSIMKKKTRDDLSIIKILTILNDYCKKNGLFNQYNNLLCEINVRHIYYRIKEIKKYSNTKMYNIKFIYKSFILLNKNFPNWKKESNYVQKMKKRNKCMLYWQLKILLKG